MNAFPASSVVVVRLGDVSYPLPASGVGVVTGRAVPAYLDTFDLSNPSGTPVSSYGFPTGSCALAAGKATSASTGANYWYATEGFPSLSGDGSLVSFPCYAVPPGSTITDSASTVKTIAVVRADGSLDVSTTLSQPFGGSPGKLVAFHSAVTQSGASPFYISAGPGYAGAGEGGFWRVPYGAFTDTGYGIAVSITTAGNSDARCVGISNASGAFQLYGSDSVSDTGFNRIFTLGSGLPAGAGVPVVLTGTGTGTTSSPWSFVFENATSVYVADDSAIATANVVRYTKAPSPGTWSPSGTFSLNTTQAIYSLAGRNEAGVGFVLYATVPAALYRLVVATGVQMLVASAGPSSSFRGVALPPSVPFWLPASPSPTISFSNSNSPTVSSVRSSSSTTSSRCELVGEVTLAVMLMYVRKSE